MPRSTLRLATINLLNLQVPGERVYDSAPVSQRSYDAKLEFLKLMLHAVNADVYGFQELWRRQALVDLFERAGLGDAYEFIARDAPSQSSPQVAIAARKGMLHLDGRSGIEDEWWTDKFPQSVVFRKSSTINRLSVDIDSFSRPVATALFTPLAPQTAEPIKIIAAHLKSKRPMNLDAADAANPAIRENEEAIGAALSSIRRTAEAAALRAMLNESMIDNATPHIVLGDLNNNSLSVSTSIITGEPRYRLIESSRRVSGKRADLGLYSVEYLQQLRSQRHTMYTHIYENRLETLDHILVSEEFYDHSLNRLWSFSEARVWNDHLAHSHGNDDHLPMQVTDHGIVDATFERNVFNG
jgi:endonuclease/exonuclease/phosphatase family metal-dependent hydrolase